MTSNAQPDYRALLKRSMGAIDDLQAKLKSLEQAHNEPIAVVGMACRFPAGGNTPAEFWNNLLNGKDGVTEVPADRWDWREVYDPNPDAPGKTYTKWGGFIDNVDQFDPLFFGITPREAVGMDPQQRLLLEISWEALENAGFAADKLEGSQTGVFVGIATSDYSQRVFKTGIPEFDTYFSSGNAHSIASGRLSYIFGFHGANFAVDTACSSSLVALHSAVQSLRNRECNLALAGGVSLMLTSDGSIMTSRSRMMSFDGRCKTFDASADGYVRGEGCGIVVVKRLADAVADGDNILAVIKGSAINQDGRSNGLTAPNRVAQEAVIRAALANADIAASTVNFIEAHGTGTSLGDPIEINALSSTYGAEHSSDNPFIVGAVKSNIGHLEGAAGVAGLIKIILAMQNRTIPPNLHFSTPNPHIEWQQIPVRIPTMPTEWQPVDDVPLRAALSSFGFSGTNAHIILEEAPVAQPKPTDTNTKPVILTQSARSSAALRQLAEGYASYLDQHLGTLLADITYSANNGRVHFDERLAIIASNPAEARDALNQWLNGDNPTNVISASASVPPEVVFLFTGQGSQYVGMGRELYQTQPVFKRNLDKCDQILREHLGGVSILDVIFGDSNLIDQTQYTQPALFAVEYALAQTWRSWNIHPTAVMGHSVGEYVAACVAGLFSLEDGLKLIAARGRLMGALPAGGTMVAVFADLDTVNAAIQPNANQVSIAAINGPENIVISGAEAAVKQVVARLDGFKSQPLTVSHAFHSPLMEPILSEFERVAASIKFNTPQIELISNVTGQLGDERMLTAAYWREHLRQSVHFSESVTWLHQQGYRTFVEIGPNPTLLGMARRAIDAADCLWLPSLRKSNPSAILESLAQLYVHGAKINWSHVDQVGNKVHLPTYPFQRQRYWLELANAQTGRSTGHPLLGNRLSTPLPIFESRISIDKFSYLADHRIGGQILLPASAYDEMALTAANIYFADSSVHSVEDVQIQIPVVLPQEGAVTLQTMLTPIDFDHVKFEIFSQLENGEWELHGGGKLSRDQIMPTHPVSLDKLRETIKQPVDVAGYYSQLRNLNANYGPTFQGIREIWTSENEVLGRIAISTPTDVYNLHPALLDSCFQLIGLGITAKDDALFVPTRQGSIQVNPNRKISDHAWAHIIVREDDSGNPQGDAWLLDDDGTLLVKIADLEFQQLAVDKRQSQHSDWFYDVEWIAKPITESAKSVGRWLIIGDNGGVASALTDQLETQSTPYTLVHANADLESVLRANIDVQDVVYLAALDSAELTLSGLQKSSARDLGGVLRIVQSMPTNARLWLVTRGSQAVEATTPTDISQAPLWGLGAVIASEHPEFNCTRIDLDPNQSDAAQLASSLLNDLTSTSSDDQIAHRGDERFVARLQRADLPLTDWTLEITERGLLDNLVLMPFKPQPPKADEVQIEVVASGLNFRDVLNAMGMYPGDPGALGNEVSGRILAVGTNITEFQVGDEVVAMTPRAFSSSVNASADLTIHKPSNLTFEQAATIPVAFLTADYALNTIAHMQAGDRVLIHAAAGGVGMAAVQLARITGAEIFGTVSSAAKRDIAHASGVKHIMNSRTLDFVHEIAHITNGEGVDIVLNSLAGDYISKSFESLNPKGRFVEIGKTGVWSEEDVAEKMPQADYNAFYLNEVVASNPKLIKTMFKRLMTAFETGVLQPLPLEVYSINNVADAFRYMAQARHIGKVVVTNNNASTARVRSDVTYLITGGLGGLGLETAHWLVSEGARSLVLIGRRVPSEYAQAAILKMERAGAVITTFQADVSQPDEVADLFAYIQESLPPLRGIFHTAGVLDDGMLMHQTWPRFQQVLAPKMDGAWILHEQSVALNLHLNFFVMYAAGAAVFGSPGQGNYAAANAFLDSLAHFRRAQGLPALSIDWGAWAEVGMAAALDPIQRQRLAHQGLGLISPRQGMVALADALRMDVPQLLIMPIDWNKLLQAAGSHTPPLLETIAQALVRQPSSVDGLQSLREAPAEERPALTLTYIQEQIARIMRLPKSMEVSGTLSLNALGIDSLMAVELRNHIKDDLGVDISLSALLQDLSVQQLARQVSDKVAVAATEQARPDADILDEPAAPTSSDLLHNLDQLSDTDIDALLGQMLSGQDANND